MTARCNVRVLVAGVSEMHPRVGHDFAFDSGGAVKAEHSMERISGPLAAGTYTVKVQASTNNKGVKMGLDDWMLSVEQVDAS